mmetsp:Transcript_18686/g.46687  ORF Transcript_18686/g.46687 Transcript_18686/m.46687 type:complete len:666 (+) Transcript_18686:578-2575(+)|eukprot:CAMPEP_0178995566 /NCGR_PEP_ID=MMETSP0795-20121207/7892_1 /TAXON_ID=88552 /ORGANISM="Amoebophrya sp., Strain Ameob2" /LENGTH=665 /DNA_ID=CAMNT_0020687875 /DNA_START=537 /DNA_END=2534 /DNA_ORIENTATION=-
MGNRIGRGKKKQAADAPDETSNDRSSGGRRSSSGGDMDPFGLKGRSSAASASGGTSASKSNPYKLRESGLSNNDVDGKQPARSSTAPGGGSSSSKGKAASTSSSNMADPYEKFSQLFAEELKSHLGPSQAKSWSWKDEEIAGRGGSKKGGAAGSGGATGTSSSRAGGQRSSTSSSANDDRKGPYESLFWAEDPRFNSAFSNIVLCPGCKTPNRVPYASKFKCYHCGALVDPGTFNTRAKDEAGYYQEAVQECEIGVAVMEQKRGEIFDEIESERLVQISMAKSAIGDDWRANELFKDLQACRYTIVQVDRQKGKKLFDISDKLVDLINLYDHAEDMQLNWRMLKDAIQNDDRVNMEIFLSELDPAFSGKCKRYVVWLMEKEREILNNLAFDAALTQALKEDDEATLLDLIEEVRDFELNYDVEFLLQQVQFIKDKKRAAQRRASQDENDMRGTSKAKSSFTAHSNRRTSFSADDEEPGMGARPKAAGRTPGFSKDKAPPAPAASKANAPPKEPPTDPPKPKAATEPSTGKPAKASAPTPGGGSSRAAASSSSTSTRNVSQKRHPEIPADLDLELPVKSEKQACELLGLDVDDYDETRAKKAYRKKALEWHPDRQQNHEYIEDATRMFQKIKEALDYLQTLLQKKTAKPPSNSKTGGGRSSKSGKR